MSTTTVDRLQLASARPLWYEKSMQPRSFFLPLVLSATLSFPQFASSSDEPLASCRSGPVTVFAAAPDRATACRVAERAMELHRRIRHDLDLKETVEVSIVLATTRAAPEDLPLDPGMLPPWLAGVALSGRQVILIRVQPGRGAAGHDPLLAHELTHVILKRDYPLSEAWPRWFKEGLAMRQARGEGLRLHASLSLAAARGRIIPLDTLWSSFPSHQAGSRVAYAQSFSVLAFLVSRHGEELFDRFMQELRNREFAEAFRAVYGHGLGRMEKEWRRHVKVRYSWIPLATGGAAFWMLIILLFFIALGARRRRSREIPRQWEEEEWKELL
jgi:hypothetical protein